MDETGVREVYRTGEVEEVRQCMWYYLTATAQYFGYNQVQQRVKKRSISKMINDTLQAEKYWCVHQTGVGFVTSGENLGREQ